MLTATAALHAACWKRTFDDVLAHYGQEPFDLERDQSPASAGCATPRRRALPAAAAGRVGPARFRVQVRGQLVEVDMTPGGTTYTLLEGRGLPLKHFGEQLRVLANALVLRADDLPLAA